jgi:hypothetical protein
VINAEPEPALSSMLKNRFAGGRRCRVNRQPAARATGRAAERQQPACGTHLTVLHRIEGGDADIAVYSQYGELIVSSNESSTKTDEVIFTAYDDSYQIEIFGYLDSEYELYIEALPDYSTGLYTDTDRIEFNINRDAFTGDAYTILASDSFEVSHEYDILTIDPWLHPAWLDVSPTGTIYNSFATVAVNLWETMSIPATAYTTVMVQTEVYYGKVNVFKEVEIFYRVN